MRTLVLLACITLLPAPLTGMQAQKKKPAQVKIKSKRRESCCDKCFKLALLGITGAAVYIGLSANPEIFPGCPGACNNAATRFTDAESQKLLQQCQANPNCPEIGYYTYMEEFVKMGT